MESKITKAPPTPPPPKCYALAQVFVYCSWNEQGRLLRRLVLSPTRFKRKMARSATKKCSVGRVSIIE